MSKRYRVQRENNEFFVYEIPSEQRIRKFNNYKQASLHIVDLDRGVGFQGWTPIFFTRECKDIINKLTMNE